MGDFGVSITTGLFTAIVTAVLTVRLSIKQFRSQRWWERQLQAYTDILDALTVLDNALALHLRAAVTGSEMPEERLKVLAEETLHSGNLLRRAAAAGDFLISDAAHKALEMVNTEDHTDQGWYSFLEVERERVRHCIAVIRAEARRELR